MARVIHTPDQHRCHAELVLLGKQPIGTIAECSCGREHVVREDGRGERYWAEKTTN